MRAFFRGNGTNVIKIAPETAIKLTFNDRIKRIVCSNPEAITPPQRLFAGAMSGAVAQVIIVYSWGRHPCTLAIKYSLQSVWNLTDQRIHHQQGTLDVTTYIIRVVRELEDSIIEGDTFLLI